MTMFQPTIRFVFTSTLIASLFVSIGYCSEKAKPAETKKSEPAKYDKVAVLTKIDAAIAKANDPAIKKFLLAMQARADGRWGTLCFGRSKLSTLPPEIGLLTELRWLYIPSNQITTLPPEVGYLTKLKRLTLRSNKITTVPPVIGKLTELIELDLCDNQLTKLPAEISKLTKLTELNLCDNQLTKLPAEISKLTKLTELDLSGNPITDADLKHLKSLKNLENLDLYKTKVTKSVVASLKKALPNCEILGND